MSGETGSGPWRITYGYDQNNSNGLQKYVLSNQFILYVRLNSGDKL